MTRSARRISALLVSAALCGPAVYATGLPATARGAASRTADPLRGDRFYVNPGSEAVQEHRQLLAQHQRAEAAAIEQIASQPEGIWLVADSYAAEVPGIMRDARRLGRVPVFVLYNLPWINCGGGGAPSPAAYRSFVDAVTRGLGQGRAVVIVEPDALSEQSCLTAARQQSYYALIGYAVRKLDGDAGASVYVDAGHPGWQPAATEARALRRVLGSARGGFSLNVSNFDPTAAVLAYGNSISAATGGRHFVVDTSRNGGHVPSSQWCNPPGAALGATPTTRTGDALADALLWIKAPGESDGTCNGGPPGGQFWLSYALKLVAGRR